MGQESLGQPQPGAVTSKTLTWEEAEKMDKLLGKFFKLEANIPVKVRFNKAQLVMKPVYGEPEPKVVLELYVCAINGESCKEKLWDITNWKLRTAFEPHVKNGNITKYEYACLKKGEGKNTTFSIAQQIE